jgi:enoyl-CoA hydratase/carnithine racemase
MLDELNRELAGFIHLHRKGTVLEIRMVKPKVNAICRRLSRSLERAALHLQDDPKLRVGILSSGNERAFSAGQDFQESTAPEAERDPGAREGGFGGITTLSSLKKPLIAAINAPAVGGGLELALSCDIMVMAESAYFQLPELKRGLLPDGGGLQRLPRRIPWFVATAMIWTGDPMTADEAHRWGLVYRTVPREQLMASAWALAHRVAEGAPLAQQAFKEALRFVDAKPDHEAMAMRADSDGDLENFRKMLSSQDMIEGQRAFLEKREPKWLGR